MKAITEVTRREPRTVLVVDDTRFVRHLLSRFLQNSGYVSLEAENGRIGWQIIRSELPDAIITDIDMPVLSGLHLIHKIRTSADSRIQLIPILVCSSMADHVRISAPECGADRFIPKPIDLRQLKYYLKSINA